MSTSPAAPPPAAPAFTRVRTQAAGAVWPRLWQALSHPLWTAALTMITAAAVVAHLFLPQLPTALAADPLARGAWLAETTGQWPAGAALASLGLFDLAQAPLLRILLPVLALALLLRLYQRLRLAWLARTLAPPVHPLPLTHTFDLTLPGPAAAEMATLTARCTRSGQSSDAGDDPQTGWGDCHHRHTWPAAGIEIGLLLALLAFALNLRGGWQIGGLQIDPGEARSLAPYSAQTLALDADATALTLCCPAAAPLPVDGRGPRLPAATQVQITQISPALRVTAAAAGQPLLLQGIEQGRTPAAALLVRFPQARSERTVAIPDRNLFLRLTGVGPSQFRVQALDAANQVLLTEEVAAAQTLTVAGVELNLHPTRSVGVAVARRPWLGLLALGAALALAGLAWRWRFPYARVGVRRNAAGVAIRWQRQGAAAPPLPLAIPPSTGETV